MDQICTKKEKKNTHCLLEIQSEWDGLYFIFFLNYFLNLITLPPNPLVSFSLRLRD